jgi:hypothetical protein
VIPASLLVASCRLTAEQDDFRFGGNSERMRGRELFLGQQCDFHTVGPEIIGDALQPHSEFLMNKLFTSMRNWGTIEWLTVEQHHLTIKQVQNNADRHKTSKADVSTCAD